ncbi:uncharacterized protein METZ01_LOCUS367732, partial [marine metagenome]
PINIAEEHFTLTPVVGFSQDVSLEDDISEEQQVILDFDNKFSPDEPLIGYDSTGIPVVEKMSQVIYDADGYPVGEIVNIVALNKENEISTEKNIPEIFYLQNLKNNSTYKKSTVYDLFEYGETKEFTDSLVSKPIIPFITPDINGDLSYAVLQYDDFDNVVAFGPLTDIHSDKFGDSIDAKNSYVETDESGKVLNRKALTIIVADTEFTISPAIANHESNQLIQQPPSILLDEHGNVSGFTAGDLKEIESFVCDCKQETNKLIEHTSIEKLNEKIAIPKLLLSQGQDTILTSDQMLPIEVVRDVDGA